MPDLKRHIPAGLYDLTPQAYKRKRNAERRIETIFESHGYQFISSPALEYRTVFEGKGSVPTSRMYGFPDANGEMLALRPDMTPAAARIAATHPRLGLGDNAAGPLRLCYIEKAYRNQAHYQGKLGEFTQAGVELMGECSPEADAEVIALAAVCLRAVGLVSFRIDIGQVDFLRGILDESGLDIALRKEIVRNMVAHDYVTAEKIVHSSPAAESARVFFSNLTEWTGGPELLSEAARCTRHPLALKAAAHLTAVYSILTEKKLADCILFDLSMAGHFDYYTGTVFRGYARGAGYAVLDGGRYDNLLSAYGCPSPAVGFAIRLDGVLDALEAQGDE